MRRAALYICYYNLAEPLVQTQVVAYLRALAQKGFEIHLLTFENGRHAARTEVLGRTLETEGIRWNRLRYHARPSLVATLYDIAIGATWAAVYCLRHRIRVIHARSHVPAAMGLALKRLLGVRLLFDVRGLLADEYADSGHWSRESLEYRLTRMMERRMLKVADQVVVLTQALKSDFTHPGRELEQRPHDVTVIPCCVDTSRYGRDSTLPTLPETGALVLAYVGKLGPVYMVDEMVELFKTARRLDRRCFLQAYTQSDPAIFRERLLQAGLGSESFAIDFVPPERLPEVLSVAHATMCLIKRGPDAIRAVSPTKLGESLAAGVPVIINSGVGDCDELIHNRRVGVVIESMSPAGYEQAVHKWLDLLSDDETRERCRRVAEEDLSLGEVGGPRYAGVYERLLGPRHP
jgi:glycosyltransferase involved in cell wall biosynthesis